MSEFTSYLRDSDIADRILTASRGPVWHSLAIEVTPDSLCEESRNFGFVLHRVNEATRRAYQEAKKQGASWLNHRDGSARAYDAKQIQAIISHLKLMSQEESNPGARLKELGITPSLLETAGKELVEMIKLRDLVNYPYLR